MLYEVNYKYDKGYVIFSGNNEYHPVLAYNENGNFYIKKRADYKLSFSEFTFPHQLMRLVLAEQIYRAFKINANEAYHK